MFVALLCPTLHDSEMRLASMPAGMSIQQSLSDPDDQARAAAGSGVCFKSRLALPPEPAAPPARAGFDHHLLGAVGYRFSSGFPWFGPGHRSWSCATPAV